MWRPVHWGETLSELYTLLAISVLYTERNNVGTGGILELIRKTCQMLDTLTMGHATHITHILLKRFGGLYRGGQA